MDAWDGEERPAAIIESFGRFQAIFSTSDDFHRICLLEIFIHYHRFSWISGMGLWGGEAWVASPIETCGPFQAGFLSSEDFHRIWRIHIDCMDFLRFSSSSCVDLWDGKARTAARIETFSLFQADFLCSDDFLSYFKDFLGFLWIWVTVFFALWELSLFFYFQSSIYFIIFSKEIMDFWHGPLGR